VADGRAGPCPARPGPAPCAGGSRTLSRPRRGSRRRGRPPGTGTRPWSGCR
jgi:hypothetical protein